MSPDVAMPPALPYTTEESERANAEWGANCGPHSLAAALGKSLEEVRPSLQGFPGYMNPTMIRNALAFFGVRPRVTTKLRCKVPCEGISRVQFEGPWLNPGVPPAAAYRYTHWIAQRNGFVLCTAVSRDGWLPVRIWGPALDLEVGPWHITHHYEILVPDLPCL